MNLLPPRFVESLRALGPVADGLSDVLANTEPSVSIRANRSKGFSVAPDADLVPWCADGCYLSYRPRFTFDPALHQGLYYVQDASSMAVDCAVRTALSQIDAATPRLFLDSCAAPGGKTTAALAALPRGWFTVANEFDYRRAEILAENIAKWGNPAVAVTRGDTARLRRLPAAFGLVLADVPCSGEGMMRKDPQAVEQWSPSLVADCAARQRMILDNLWPAIAPGGFLIYSTCTFNRTENEEIVRYLVESYGAEPVEMPLAGFPGVQPGIDTPWPCYRFIPGKVRGEGLFICLLRKPDGHRSRVPKISGRTWKADKALAPLLNLPSPLFSSLESKIRALDAPFAPAAELVAANLDVLTLGIEIGTIKGHDIVPSQNLAMSTALAPNAFPAVEVDTDTALAYLRRDAVTLPEGTPRGIVLLTCRPDGSPAPLTVLSPDAPNVALGFVKNLGNRSNNLYPAHWRILSRS